MEIKAVLGKHIQAANDGDSKEFLATWDKSCSDYIQQAAVIEQSNKVYDLRYSLEQWKVIESNESKAKLLAVFCTQKIKGPQFRNNRTWQLLA